jgi:DNA-binding transcriptional regulator YiaG
MTADELKEARQQLGLSVNGMADLLGVDERTLRAWEFGERHGKPNSVPGPVALLVFILLNCKPARKLVGIE